MAVTRTRTFSPTKEQSLLSLSGDYKGTSLENHFPIGRVGDSGSALHTGLFRGLIKFGVDFDGMSAIESATLTFRISTQVHAPMSSTGPSTPPTLRAFRITSSWDSTGGNQHTTQSQKTTSWTVGADEDFDSFDPPTMVDTLVSSDSEWDLAVALPSDERTFSFDVTSMVQEWFDGATNRGFYIRAVAEGNTALSTPYDFLEAHGMRGLYPPYLSIEYTYDPQPEAPTLTAPTSVPSGTTPGTFSFSFAGDATISSYDLQVGTTLNGSDLWNVVAGTSGLTGTTVSATYAGSSIPKGQTVYWRARGTNSLGESGPWSSGTLYVYAAPSTPTYVSPTAALPYAYIHNLNDLAVWSGSEAKPRITLGYSHPDGLASTSWEISVGGVVTTHNVTVESGDSHSFDVSTTVARNTNTTLTARVQSVGGQWSAWTSSFSMKVNWAQGVYEHNHTVSATGLEFGYSPVTGGSETRAAFAFRKSQPATGPWCSSVSDVVPGTHVQVLVRLSTTNAAQNPALPDMTLTYTLGTAAKPDHWVISGAMLIQSPERAYFGSHSSRVMTMGSSGYLRATSSGSSAIRVDPGTPYTFSVYINTKGAALAGSGVVGIRVKSGSGDIIATGETTTNTSAFPRGWQRLEMTFTPSVSAVYPEVYFTNDGLTNDMFFVDCAMLEEGSRASRWHPGALGVGATVDAGGLQVDGTYGSTFRLRGATGGLLDIVTLGLRGLKFGDTEVYGSSAGMVTVGGALTTTGGITAGGNTSVTGTLSSTGLLSGGSISTAGTAATGDLTVTGTASVTSTMSVTGALTVGNTKPVVRTYTVIGANVWTKPAGLSHIVVEVYGAGGGGGGTNTLSGSTAAAAASGGAGGGYGMRVYTAAELASAATCTLTVGTGGTAGATTPTNGGVGGDTTFSGTGITTLTAKGGTGGNSQTTTTGAGSAAGVDGVLGTNGTINIRGKSSMATRVNAGVVMAAGRGADGGGPIGGSGANQTYNAAGATGFQPGGGGGGGNQSGAAATTARAGGQGGNGYGVITEYYLP